MGLIEIEKQRTIKFLEDLISTLEETIYYLKPNNKLYNLLKERTGSIFSMNTIYNMSEKLIVKIKDFINDADFSREYYKKLRNFIFGELKLLIDVFNSFFNKIAATFKNEVFEKEKWLEENPITLLSASYFLLNLTFNSLKNFVNKYFDIGFKEHIELQVIDDSNSIWEVEGMQYKEFDGDINKIQNYAKEILKDCDSVYSDDIILQLQISEFIKNAIRHGNKLDKSKKVKVWYDITNDYAKLIIEDEGEGFKNLEEWNKFNKQRLYYLQKQDIMNILKYSSFKTKDSIENDGGNFLFSALEYWDSGVIYNTKRNKVYVMKYFY